jgi:hypothetical protein
VITVVCELLKKIEKFDFVINQVKQSANSILSDVSHTSVVSQYIAQRDGTRKR